MYVLNIDGYESILHIIKYSRDNQSILGIVTSSHDGHTNYVVGQCDFEDNYCEISYVKDEYVFDIIKGVIDWENPQFWQSSRYLYNQQMCGTMQRVPI